MFKLTEEQLQEGMAGHTAREIYQQPGLWQKTLSELFQQRESTRGFLEDVYAKHDRVRVIFTGAGTSAFAGDTIAPALSAQHQKNVHFESVPTTDIVSNPTNVFMKDEPTILVSFARSGNSPESVAAVKLGTKLVDDFYQVVITCNKDGQLAKNTQGDERSITFCTPEEANDKSMAMTSSFTSMILAAFALFTVHPFTGNTSSKVIANGEHLLDKMTTQIDQLLEFDFERIIYLGSGLLGQLAHEAALKMLELSAGQVVAVHESSLGFRHGPKSILNDKSVVVLFMSQDPYTRKYDMDILREVAADESGLQVVVLTEQADEEIEKLADVTVAVNFGQESLTTDFQLALLYILFGQALALKNQYSLASHRITQAQPAVSTVL